MTTVYELNFSGETIQISKDLIFGWCVRTAERGMEFQPITSLDDTQFEFLKNFPYPAYIPQEFREALTKLAAERLSKPETTITETPPSKSTETAGVVGVTPTAILMSRMAIGRAICERLQLVEQDRYIADLEYCRVERQTDAWVVTGVSSSCKVEVFLSVETAIEYIARRWW